MLPKYHFLAGLILTLLIYFCFSITLFQAALILLSSFLLDFDHYAYYAAKKKDPSLRNAYAWFLKKRKIWNHDKNKILLCKYPLLLFHSIEFMLLLVLFALVYKLFLFVLIGAVFHLCLDLIELAADKGSIKSKLSLIYVYKTNKNRKKLD